VKKRLILVFAVICSAVGGAFPPLEQRAESAVMFGAAAKCAIPNQAEAYRQAKAVFTGEVTGEKKNGDVRTFEFAVAKYWKGPVRETIKIDVYETTRYQAPFRNGEKYLVYAAAVPDGKKGNLRVVRCSRSRSLGEAADDLKQLGKGQDPR
jgi:hypothetical protein